MKDGSLSQHSYPTLPQRRTGGRKLPPTPRKPSTLNLGVVGTVVLAAQRGNREHTARHRTGIDLFHFVFFIILLNQHHLKHSLFYQPISLTGSWQCRSANESLIFNFSVVFVMQLIILMMDVWCASCCSWAMAWVPLFNNLRKQTSIFSYDMPVNHYFIVVKMFTRF